MKLDFVCIGAQKSGTTSLHDTLKNHSNVILPKNKEALFFEYDEYYYQGLEFLKTKYFGDTNFKNKTVGFFDPNFDLNDKSLERLKFNFPKIKIIYIIRKPIDRAFSHYKMTYSRGLEELDFTQALIQEESRLKTTISHNYHTKKFGFYEKDNFGYVNRSIYSKTILNLYNLFPKNSIYINTYENLISNQKKVLAEIQSFLGLSIQLSELCHSNKSWKPKSRYLSKVLFSSKRNYLLRILSKILNKKTKFYIKSQIKKLNTSKSTSFDHNYDFEKLSIKYFSKEKPKLRIILNDKSLWL